MAVNRLLLKCLRCRRESIPIARLQVGMDDVWLPSRVREDEYESWLEKHSQCGHDAGEFGLRVGLCSETEDALALGPPVPKQFRQSLIDRGIWFVDGDR